ncbi:MAG: citrate transporter [Ruminococcaceae bacterium]|nr:citrate transporter [Oscillospiraceae bacterium]
MRFTAFLKKHAVLLIAMLAAAVTVAFVPLDREYLGYYDVKTLTCLFCVLAVVQAFANIDLFYILARKVVQYFRNTRLAVLALVWITAIGSMFLTNDTALLTFLPLSYFVLHSTKQDKYLALTFVLQNCAANLGGMLTPFGNPQNLYLYTKFSVEGGEFLSIMLPPFLISSVLFSACCLLIKPEPLTVPEAAVKTDTKRAVIYAALFLLALAVVLRFIHFAIGLIVIPAVLLLTDRKALRQVDYGLLLTFAAFFTFSGNMARIEAVQNLFSALLQRDTLIVSALLSQIISNVPAAILLSQFTDNYAALLQGVNVGGAGTLIASLASLITYQQFVRYAPREGGKFLKIFSVINVAFLVILLAAMKLLG